MPDPTPTPAAAPAVASTIGLKNLVIAPVESDSESATTYGDLQRVAGAIEASITPSNTDPDVQYYDDVEGDVLYPDPELSFKTKLADIPLTIQEMIFGNEIDNNGVLIRTATDKPGYFAVGFKSEKFKCLVALRFNIANILTYRISSLHDFFGREEAFHIVVGDTNLANLASQPLINNTRIRILFLKQTGDASLGCNIDGRITSISANAYSHIGTKIGNYLLCLLVALHHAQSKLEPLE